MEYFYSIMPKFFKMAKFKSGILGPISGKVGSVIGSSWNGVHYLRSRSSKSVKPATKAQAEVRTKFKLASEVVKPLMPFYRIGYAAASGNITVRNKAMQQVITGCITGELPDLLVEYEKIQLADGYLPPIVDGAVRANTGATLDVVWTYDRANREALATDHLMFAAYCPELNQATVNHLLAVRENETVTMKLPAHYKGNTVHCYAAFVSTESFMEHPRPEAISVSSYLGAVDVL